MRCICGAPVGYTWGTHGLSTVRPWVFRVLIVGRPWGAMGRSRAVSVGYPYGVCESPLTCSWVARGMLAERPWVVRDVYVRRPWVVSGLFVGSPRDVRRSWGVRVSPAGCP